MIHVGHVRLILLAQIQRSIDFLKTNKKQKKRMEIYFETAAFLPRKLASVPR
jgi:hypothetical protein